MLHAAGDMFAHNAYSREERNMSDSERIEMLEKALIKYVELYGFIDEARAYYIQHARSTV